MPGIKEQIPILVVKRPDCTLGLCKAVAFLGISRASDCLFPVYSLFGSEFSAKLTWQVTHLSELIRTECLVVVGDPCKIPC